MWSQIEATPPHLTYLLLSAFLLTYALFSLFIRNRLHVSEPPLATLLGIALGPRGLHLLQPEAWGLDDKVMLEITRVVVAVQCFVVGVELPATYLRRNWRSVAMLLGPVMAFGWLVCGAFVHLLLGLGAPTALVISACLTPTDPVLAASVLSGSQFSERLPLRLRHLLSAESGSNDGFSLPFLYVGLSILTRSTLAGTLKEWFLVTVLYQCVLGVVVGTAIGWLALRVFKFADARKMVSPSSYILLYLVLALFAIGVASTLGMDDFLVAFGAGRAFAHRGLFWEKVQESQLPGVVDVNLNSMMFIYFGATIPWAQFTRSAFPHFAWPRLLALLALILLFRRIPVVLALKPLIPGIRTWAEALFAGHFGPIGVGALFLAIEARAELETGTPEPLPHVPPPPNGMSPPRQRAAEVNWPIICFVVLGSTMVHGLSTLVISVVGHYSRRKEDRAPLIGAETDMLWGMAADVEVQDGDLEEADGDAM